MRQFYKASTVSEMPIRRCALVTGVFLQSSAFSVVLARKHIIFSVTGCIGCCCTSKLLFNLSSSTF
jgi:hypothetical protein